MIAILVLAALGAGAAGDSACAAARPQLEAAVKALEARDFAAAQRIADPLRDEYPTCPDVIVAAGRAHQGQGDYPSASTLSELAVLFGPDDPSALLFRGEMLAMQGSTPQAQELIEKACTLEPKNAAAHFQLGTLFDRTRRHQKAAAEFETAVKLAPANPQAWDYLALNLEPLGDISGAEAAYKKGLAVNTGPDFDAFLDYNYGKLLLKLNRLEESKAHLDKAMELAPNVRAVHYDHAKLNFRMGKLEDARHDAERAASIPDPGGFILDLQVYSLLATIYTHLGDQDLARKYIDLARHTSVPLRSRERK